MNAIDEMACATPGCDNRGKPGLNIVGYGSFATKSGRRRRYRCTVCRGTLSTNTGTAYSGLRCTRREFDQVASLRVEGVSISATARVTGHSRNTVARNLIRASVPERVAMLLTGHKSRAIFDRYNIIHEQELLDAGDQLVAYLAQQAQAGPARPRPHPAGPAAPRTASPLRLVRRGTA